MAYIEHTISRTTGTTEDPDSRIQALFREWLAAYPALKSAQAALETAGGALGLEPPLINARFPGR